MSCISLVRCDVKVEQAGSLLHPVCACKFVTGLRYQVVCRVADWRVVQGNMASTYEPEFTGETVAPSSADASYHPVAIQLYGHASKFNGTTTNHVRDDLRPRLWPRKCH